MWVGCVGDMNEIVPSVNVGSAIMHDIASVVILFIIIVRSILEILRKTKMADGRCGISPRAPRL